MKPFEVEMLLQAPRHAAVAALGEGNISRQRGAVDTHCEIPVGNGRYLILRPVARKQVTHGSGVRQLRHCE